MELQFLGAAGTVTGSKSILKYDNKIYMIDAGLFQGEGHLEKNNLLKLEQEIINDLKAIFITHAHLDHCGFLPYLVSQGFSGPIFMSEATKELVITVLEDAYSILENEQKEGQIKDMPYTKEDLNKINSMINVKQINVEHSHDSLKFQFFEAGHILGACSLWIEWNNKRILFSGDLGRADDFIHKIPFKCNRQFENIVIEGTYGGRTHTVNSVFPTLLNAVEHVVKNDGVLFIPSFAIARSAIVLKVLYDFFEEYKSKKLKIFVDSPMMIKALRIYLKFADQLKIEKDQLEKILDSVKMIEFPKDRKKFQKFNPPYILLSSSGMLTGGRSVEHFERLALKDKNYILFVGYQGEGTLGRKILEGENNFLAYGKTREVRSIIGHLTQLSAHADENEIIDYLKDLEIKPTHIFINHAEIDASKKLFEKITSDLKINTTIAKENLKYEI